VPGVWPSGVNARVNGMCAVTGGRAARSSQPKGSPVAEPSRRFPSPWRADKVPGGYVVRDANGQALAYLYSRENEAEARQAKVLTKDEARRIAVNIARLPELLGKGGARLRLDGPTSSQRIAPCAGDHDARSRRPAPWPVRLASRLTRPSQGVDASRLPRPAYRQTKATF
jgi:hypothetical protein